MVSIDCRIFKFPVAGTPTDYEVLSDGQQLTIEGAQLK